MAEHPIIMHARSVQGILAGRKVQTRRPTALRSLRRVAVGDTLWVRERWAYVDGGQAVVYFADDGWETAPEQGRDLLDDGRWRPSIHMPRWASRLTLRVTGVRVERLQAITCTDVLREGLVVDVAGPHLAQSGALLDSPRLLAWPSDSVGIGVRAKLRAPFRDAWRDAWDGIYAGRGWGWDTDPEVRVIDFEVAP